MPHMSTATFFIICLMGGKVWGHPKYWNIHTKPFLWSVSFHVTAHWFQTFEGFIFQLLARIQTFQGSNFLLLARFQKVKGLIFVFSNVTSFLLVVKNWIQTLKGFILGGDFLIQTFKGLKPRFFSVFLVNWARFWDAACLFSAGVAVFKWHCF